MTDVSIQRADQESFNALIPLIAAYQRFYGVEPNEANNAAHFGRLLSDPSRGLQLVAVTNDGQVVGFATLYVTLSSLRARSACVLNDLFVLESHRRSGVARRLIAHALQVAKAEGFTELEWMTQESNLGAQNLYDSLGAEHSRWYAYSLGVDSL